MRMVTLPHAKAQFHILFYAAIKTIEKVKRKQEEMEKEAITYSVIYVIKYILKSDGY